MTLHEFYCQRWRESFRENNPFPFIFTNRSGDDRADDLAFGFGLLLFYWLLFLLWVFDWLKAERQCLHQGHDWDGRFAKCVRCEISHKEQRRIG